MTETARKDLEDKILGILKTSSVHGRKPTGLAYELGIDESLVTEALDVLVELELARRINVGKHEGCYTIKRRYKRQGSPPKNSETACKRSGLTLVKPDAHGGPQVPSQLPVKHWIVVHLKGGYSIITADRFKDFVAAGNVKPGDQCFKGIIEEAFEAVPPKAVDLKAYDLKCFVEG